MKQLFAIILSTTSIFAFASATPVAAQVAPGNTQDQTPYMQQSNRTQAYIPPVRPTRPMTAAALSRSPGLRAGIASTRSSVPQSRDRPVVQPKRRPKKGRREVQ